MVSHSALTRPLARTAGRSNVSLKDRWRSVMSCETTLPRPSWMEPQHTTNEGGNPFRQATPSSACQSTPLPAMPSSVPPVQSTLARNPQQSSTGIHVHPRHSPPALLQQESQAAMGDQDTTDSAIGNPSQPQLTALVVSDSDNAARWVVVACSI